ncbi:MAG: hypothetical protein RBU23_12970 [Candidatus Auribacterota bacterium]|jgi:hypothetical protein|nr:hypothetical protein [Candidatus Auribacterota bacterium]
MTERTEAIKRKLQEMFAGSEQVFPATVKEVNEDEFTCTILFDDELEYTDVRLRSVIDPEKQGFCFIPKIESMVLVGRIANSDQLFIALFSDIDKIIFVSPEQNTSLLITEQKVEIIAGDRSLLIDGENGLIVFNENDKNSFATDINKLTERLNTIEQDINNLKTVFKTGWVPVAMDGGAALKVASATWAGQSLTATKVDDIKDELIKH